MVVVVVVVVVVVMVLVVVVVVVVAAAAAAVLSLCNLGYVFNFWAVKFLLWFWQAAQGTRGTSDLGITFAFRVSQPIHGVLLVATFPVHRSYSRVHPLASVM